MRAGGFARVAWNPPSLHLTCLPLFLIHTESLNKTFPRFLEYVFLCSAVEPLLPNCGIEKPRIIETWQKHFWRVSVYPNKWAFNLGPQLKNDLIPWIIIEFSSLHVD